mmetsp:Transcript_4409/g.8845  ORF Transcript_4409/g.8845 Transcript_4409/m.8845 type:complete len:201 (+) Transcript_4409:238-840(+)
MHLEVAQAARPDHEPKASGERHRQTLRLPRRHPSHSLHLPFLLHLLRLWGLMDSPLELAKSSLRAITFRVHDKKRLKVTNLRVIISHARMKKLQLHLDIQLLFLSAHPFEQFCFESLVECLLNGRALHKEDRVQLVLHFGGQRLTLGRAGGIIFRDLLHILIKGGKCLIYKERSLISKIANSVPLHSCFLPPDHAWADLR